MNTMPWSASQNHSGKKTNRSLASNHMTGLQWKDKMTGSPCHIDQFYTELFQDLTNI